MLLFRHPTCENTCVCVKIFGSEQRRVETVQVHISVLVFPPFKRRVTARRLRRVVEAALAVGAGKIPPEVMGSEHQEVSLVITDDEALLMLNRAYRGLDEVTDVLSFSPHHAGPYEGDEEPTNGEDMDFPDFPEASDEAGDLGEVVVSYPQAKRQAIQARHPVAQEVETLVVHGVLHLLGYDHAEPDEERVMFGLQDKALAMIKTETDR
jgi:probable rRNA maturation factor